MLRGLKGVKTGGRGCGSAYLDHLCREEAVCFLLEDLMRFNFVLVQRNVL